MDSGHGRNLVTPIPLDQEHQSFDRRRTLYYSIFPKPVSRRVTQSDANLDECARHHQSQTGNNVLSIIYKSLEVYFWLISSKVEILETSRIDRLFQCIGDIISLSVDALTGKMLEQIGSLNHCD